MDTSLYRASQLSVSEYPNLLSVSEYPYRGVKKFSTNVLLVGDAVVNTDTRSTSTTAGDVVVDVDRERKTGIFAYETKKWWFFNAKGVVDDFESENVQILDDREDLQELWNSHGLPRALFEWDSKGFRFKSTIEKLRSLMLDTTMDKKCFYKGEVIYYDSILNYGRQGSYNVSRGYYKWNSEKGGWDLYLVEHSGDTYVGDFVPTSVPRKVECYDGTIRKELPAYFGDPIREELPKNEFKALSEDDLQAMDYNELVHVLKTQMLGLEQQLAEVERAASASRARSDLVVKIAALLYAHSIA